ncbi:MAG: chemotaxis-specific protein-glutamate methyltransferase CheB [Bacteroidota bacterium]
MRNDPVNIVIVDDSAVCRKFLSHVLGNSSGIIVSGTASNGPDALDLIQKIKPHLVLMDINMPGMDGFETTSRIMNLFPLPVIIISGEYTPQEVAKTFRALEVGAVDILPKPPGEGSPGFEKEISKLIMHIRLMSEVKVVKRNLLPGSPFLPLPTPFQSTVNPAVSHFRNSIPKIIGIGASAGGPIAIQQILLGLDMDFKIPIVIVQHIEAVFTDGFAQFLELTTQRKISVAYSGMILKPGMIVIPPGDTHLGFGSQGTILLNTSPPDRGLRPSVNHLFTSMANTYGADSLGILLTGMGADGVRGMSLMFERGAVTIAQDAESSMIHGMPGEAIKAGAAKFVFSLEQIQVYLNDINRLNN